MNQNMDASQKFNIDDSVRGGLFGKGDFNFGNYNNDLGSGLGGGGNFGGNGNGGNNGGIFGENNANFGPDDDRYIKPVRLFRKRNQNTNETKGRGRKDEKEQKMYRLRQPKLENHMENNANSTMRFIVDQN